MAKFARLTALLMLLSLLHQSAAQECDTSGLCDKHERCPVWKDQGECIENKAYMDQFCPGSCLRRREAVLTGECEDLHERCSVWAGLGECQANPEDMNDQCTKSCGKCTVTKSNVSNSAVTVDVDVVDADTYTSGCTDNHKKCSAWAGLGECKKNPGYMKANCAKSCKTCAKSGIRENNDSAIIGQTESFGVKQKLAGSRNAETVDVIKRSVTYMKSDKVAALPKDVRNNCQNRNEHCSFWAVIGECEKNKAYMTTNCAPSCNTCHLIGIKGRCPELETAVPALKSGDLNKMFDRVVRTAPGNRSLSDAEREELTETNMTQYTVRVHSRPSETLSEEVSIVLDKSLPPWVLTLDDFLTEQECEAMIEMGYKYGYKRSEDVSARKFDGTHDSVKSERRTSENALCSNFDGCRSKTIPNAIHDSMGRIMGIPPQNNEDLQIERFEVGQFYRLHHDYIPHQTKRQSGPRILTFLLYLSDVDEGGGTRFPSLGLTIAPKRGRALLWPSVYNANPTAKDNRMMHEELEVEKGVKFAANGWIHMYDYIEPQKTGCN